MKAGVDFTEGPILKKFLLFAIPVLLTNLMQQLYNSADIMIVGKFAGETALAAVGSTAALTNLIVNLFVGFAVGSNVLCARCYGAQDKEGLSRALHTSILLGLLLGFPLAFIGWFASGYFLEIMGTPADVIDKATLYMRIYFLGSPASMVYNYGAAVLRSVGDTKRPLYILAASGIINVFLNLLCVVVFKMDVAGVAIGTIASQLVSALAVVVIFMKSDSDLKLTLGGLSIHKKELKQIAAVGVPAGINGAMFSLSNVILQSAVNSFGSTVMAANSVASNYTNFAYILVAAGEQACTSFVGQNMGARKYERIGKIVTVSLLVTGIAVMIYSAVIVLNGKFFLGLFTTEPDVVKYGMVYVRVVIIPYVLIMPSVVLGGALRGMGHAVSQTVISLVFICLVRVLWVAFVLPLNNVYEMVFVSYPVSWIAAALAAFTVFLIAQRNLLKAPQAH